MHRLTGITLAALVAAGTALGVGAVAAAADDGDIPDAVLLSTADFQGAQVTSGTPDPDGHPLPLRPCADATRPTPQAERTITATIGNTRVYEHVASYPAGQAGPALEQLRAELASCPRPADGQQYRVLAQYTTGIMLERDYNDLDDDDPYSVGVAGDYLVTVMAFGTAGADPDVTTVSGLGQTAIRRAGGQPGEPMPSASPTDPLDWTTFQADVTGVRRGATPQTLLVDVTLPAGEPTCARNPQIGYHEESDTTIWANVGFESAGGNCPQQVPDQVTYVSPTPIGDRIVVLNQQLWEPDGAGYRRCDSTLGCTPPADHCADQWITKAIGGMDVPKHGYRDMEYCDGGWLVLTIDVNTAQCGVEPRPGCSAPADVTRHFLRFDTQWQEFAATKTAGCATVQAIEPSFPTAICADLPATG